MDLERDGARHCVGYLDEAACRDIETALESLPAGQAGVRIARAPAVAGHLGAASAIGRLAASVLGAGARPVRAVLFDKTAARNWALGWHQDRTIAVRHRIDTPGFGPWTRKHGLLHVEPPFAIIDRMMTLRIHLDPVDAANAPLRIVPGSHRLGRLTEDDIARVVADRGERDCLAGRGDVWLYATPIVHGSRAAAHPRQRPVLQVDYSADPTPGPLCWLGL